MKKLEITQKGSPNLVPPLGLARGTNGDLVKRFAPELAELEIKL